MLEIFSAVVGAAILAAVAGVIALNWLFPITGARLLRNIFRNKAGLVQKELLVNGNRVPYLVGGSGEALILVHGFTANKDTFDAVARYLTPHYTVYVPDLPGHGDTERDLNMDASAEAFLGYVRQFAQALGLKRVHWGGNSLGAGIASHYAANFPEEVASLWLIDCVATGEFLTDSEMVKHYDATGKFPYLVQTHEEFARKMDIVYGKPARMPNCISFTLGIAAIRDFEIQSAMFKSFRNAVPIENLYSNLKTPALIDVGDKDALDPVSSTQTLAKVFPHSTIQVIEGAGHIPMVDHADRTARAYLDFRAELAANK